MSFETSPSDRPSLKVIACGLQRTGTHSLAVALEELGFGPVQHYFTLIEDPERFRGWIEAWTACVEGKGSFTRKDWDEVLASSVSVCDFPACAFADELAEQYPDAKIIINYRDDVEGWIRSIKETIWKRPQLTDIPFPIRIFLPWIGHHRHMFALWQKLNRSPANPYNILGMRGMTEPEKHLRRAYHRHYAYMDKCMPSERTIRWTPKDGWEPLCKFLQVPVPSTPFPHTNSTGDFWNRVGTIERRARPLTAWIRRAGVGMFIAAALAAGIALPRFWRSQRAL